MKLTSYLRITALTACSLALLPASQADVVLHYSFDSDYTDSSGNENHGLLYDSSDNGSALITAAASVFGDGGMAQGDKNDRVNLTTPFTPVNDTPWTIAFWCDLNGGAATYGFNTDQNNSVRARADSDNELFVSINDEFYSFASAGIITQNSKNNHIVIVAHPSGIDLDGVAGDDRLAVYANGQLLDPKSGYDVTDASVSTAIEVQNLGYSGRWPEGSDGDYDEFWILDEALDADAVANLYEKNHPGALWYVNVDTPAAIEAQDGLSWETAFADLQDGLAAAEVDAMIWVANGTYYPVVPVDPANPTVDEQRASFELKAGQQIYGGFKGTEDSLDERSNSKITKLSGDIGQDDGTVDMDIGFSGENSRNIVSVNGVENCLINGFTILQGGSSSENGGGLSVVNASMVTIESCEFRNNTAYEGGAVYLDSTAAWLTSCEFKSNHASSNGGAVYADSSANEGSPEFDLIDCLFESNQSGTRGGAIRTTYTDNTFERCSFTNNVSLNGGAAHFYRSDSLIVNTLFSQNTATSLGGALLQDNAGSLDLQHVTLYGNTATVEGHHIYTDGNQTHTMKNSVMWHGESVPATGGAFYDDTAVDYTNSLVQGVDLTSVGSGNLDGTLAVNDPEFTDPDDAELMVRAYSPLVNAGVAIDGIEFDMDGQDRLIGAAVDIGCYEHEYPFEVSALLTYTSYEVGEVFDTFDFTDTLESSDDALTFSSSNESVVIIAHPDDEDADESAMTGEVTVVGIGTSNVVFDFQYQGGAVHQFIQPVQVAPLSLELRDLSSLVDVDYTAADFGVPQDYADLSAIFIDSPTSFSVVSADADVFTVSQTAGDVAVLPVGYGQADLTLRAHYSDGTVFEMVRSVTVSLPTGTLAAADAVEAQNYGINGDVSSYTFADLSVFLSEGGASVAVSSSDASVYTVSESGGIVTVTPVAVGSADITIELISSGGERYTIQKTLRVLDHEGQLLAHYLLDGDATDAQGQYDATVSAEGIVWSVDDVVLGEAGALIAPDTLTEDLFLIDGSLRLDLNFKVESSAEDGVKMLASIKANNSSVVRAGGLMLSYAESDDLVNLFLSYADGVSIDDYRFSQIATCVPGHWYSLQLVFDFDLGVWTIEVEDQSEEELLNQFMIGEIENNSDYAYDIDSFKMILQSNPLRIGAFDQHDEQDPAKESEVRIDDVLVYSPAPAIYLTVNAALDAFTAHVTGVTLLSDVEQAAHLETLEEQLILTSFTKVKSNVEAFMQAYEDENEPVFMSDSKVTPSDLTSVTQALITVQQWVHNEAFAPETLDEVSHYTFEAGEVFPGSIENSVPRVVSATVSVDGDYATDSGALMIWADTVLRPLGYYVPAGELVTISVDPAVTALGLEVVVGAHSRNLDEDEKPSINRFRDIAAEFSLDQSTITVANAFGGGLYLRIPDGTSAGEITLTIEGAVKSAYFSTRAGKETDVAAWLTEVAASEVPWVDFESDKFMFTVPLSSVQTVTEPAEIMARWDDIMDEYRYMNGRPLDNRIRAEYYLLDRMLVTPTYGAGYPLVVSVADATGVSSDFNPLNVLTVAPNRTLFHEFGHNCAIPGPVFEGGEREISGEIMTLGNWAEEESLVNLPAVIIYNRIYGYSFDAAFAAATAQDLDIDQAAMDWFVTENFRLQQSIGLDTSGVFDISDNNEMDELRYQARGLARYAAIVSVFGWEGLNRIHSEFYPIRDEDIFDITKKRHRLTRDALIRRASEALEVNMAPMFHLWGIHASDELRAELATYPKNRGIQNLLEYYRLTVPGTVSEYGLLRDELYSLVGGRHQPRYDYYDTELATDLNVEVIGTRIDEIIALYGLDETGDEPSDLAVRMRPDGRVDVSWQSTVADEAGYVIRAQAAGDVVATELGTASVNASTFVSSVLTDGAYTFTVAVVYSDGTESLPGELIVASIPSEESSLLTLEHQVYDGGSFQSGDLSTITFSGSSTGGSGGSFAEQVGSSLKVSADVILSALQTQSEDDSLTYDSVAIQSVTLVLPDGFFSGPSVVEVLSDAVQGYDAYAGGENTTGDAAVFSEGSQRLDMTDKYTLGEGDDFYFFLYNHSENNNADNESAYLEIEYEVVDGYRYWYESHGLERLVDAPGSQDPDGDGVVNLLEYALGRDPLSQGEGAVHTIHPSSEPDSMQLRFQHERADVRYQIESTADLSDWAGASVVWDSRVDIGDLVGLGEAQSVDLSTDIGDAHFYRLRVTPDFFTGIDL